jgi:cytochrome c oxidase subunit I+III
MTPEPDAVRERFAKVWESPPGFSGWLATVNSRPLGKRYMVTALVFFGFGALLALAIRFQLAVPDNSFLSPALYNGVFTMHGSTMLYLFAVPFIEGLGIYLIPMLVGSRDLAFPRLTNFGYWLYLFGGVTMYASIFFGEIPDAGWTAYPPLSGPKHSGVGIDFWLLGVSLLEIAGITAAVEIVVTILKLRAPGMTVRQIPIIVWSYLVAGLMIIFAFTPLFMATLMLEADRSLGTHFFNPGNGGSTLLWQHLFWWFGHPEVYIIFMPATGVLSLLIPVLARRRLVAHSWVVAAIVSTGFVSFGLWSHHMFAAGIPDLPMHFFTAASYMIALASGVQIFAWVATLWGSRPEYSLQLFYVLGFFFIFVNGGLTGVMVATMSFDWQVHETAFIVAHFHHVLIGGAVLPLFAGLHFWLPKINGRTASEGWGKIAFGVIFIGFNLTFIPMYVIGLLGMRRRVYTYSEVMGVETLNLVSTIGAFVLVLGFAGAFINLVGGALRGRKAGDNPWNAGTLEWSLPSPPPSYGFARPPVVRDRYPVWNAFAEDSAVDGDKAALMAASEGLAYRPSRWRATLLTDVTNARPQAVQFLPGPTLWPFFAALSILIIAASFLAKTYLVSFGASIVALACIARWVLGQREMDEEEASLLRSRLSLPLAGLGTRSCAWWGTLALIVILFIALGSLVFSYFYLWLYSESWPQAELELPSPGLPAASLLLLFSSVLVRARFRGKETVARRRALWWEAASAIATGVGFLTLSLLHPGATSFPPSVNAYASVFHAISGFSMLVVALGIAIHVVALGKLWRCQDPGNSPGVLLSAQIARLYWRGALACAGAGYTVLYLAPPIIQQLI